MSEDQPDIEVLDRPTCLRLVHDATVGRLAWAEDDGRVTVVPVNVALDGEDVVLRSGEGAKLAALRTGRPVALQADELEPALRAGWSVLLRGRVREVVDPGEVHRLAMVSAAPWARGPKDHYLRLLVDDVSGRRLPPHSGHVDVLGSL